MLKQRSSFILLLLAALVSSQHSSTRAAESCIASLLVAQRDLKDIPPADPELERQSFQVADGFEVNLFAADPAIAKPIQMNFDAQGRLWIASSEVYPQIMPGQKANDKILVLEDTDGDGQSDRTTAFADGLLIPTGVEPGDGGAYVANSTQLLHLADTDGDGKADSRRIVLSGFGTEDTHHILHTFRWGPDGRMYINQSIYIHSHVETAYGVRRLNAGGIWQFRPETMQLEVFARGWVNAWGHQFDAWGQSFVTDGAGGEGINYVVPGAAYPTAAEVPRILHGLNPGHPKYCGLEVVSGRHLPEDWQGNLITNDFRGHRVCRFVISEDGSGFAARQEADLIRTNHVAFRPIDVAMGPDGAIYIADWYNPIIQHGEVDFRDPRRDHTHGRIWRVTRKERPTVERPQLVDASVPQLLDSLKSPEGWTRQQAKRVLKERGRDEVIPELAPWVGRLDSNDPAFEHHRLEALWTYQSLDIVEAPLLEGVLQSPDHRARAAATRVLQSWQTRIPDAFEMLAARAEDEHPRVRLEAVRALAELADPRAVGVALRALDHPLDEFLEYALWLTCWETRSRWLPLARAGKFDYEGRPERLVFALQAVHSPEVVEPLVRLLDAERVPAHVEQSALEMIAQLGRPEDLRLVFDLALSAKGERTARLLNALAEAARRRKVQPSGDLTSLRTLLQADAVPVRAAAARAAGTWKVTALEPVLEEMARRAEEALPARRAALDALASLASAGSRRAIEELAQSGEPAPVRTEAIAALSRLDRAAAATAAVEWLSQSPPLEQQTRLFSAFVQQKEGAGALVAALAGRSLPEDVAKIGLRVVTGSGRDEPELTGALTAAGSITGGPKVLGPEEMARLVADVTEHGDPHRGEAVYRRADLACLNCHAIGGAGGRVGPDLVSVGASAQVDYLIDSLLEPNKQVKENYNTIVVSTVEGRIISGVRIRQTETDLLLRDAEDRELAIPLNSIEEQGNGTSIMPAGLTEKLTRQELVDLVRFLSELGKVGGAFAVEPTRVVRRWGVLNPTPEAAVQLRRGSDGQAATDDPTFTWVPAYSTVGGELPLADLPPLQVQNKLGVGERRLAFARFELDVTTPGPVTLLVNDVEGLAAWLGGDPIALEPETVLELPAGRQRITVSIDLGVRRQPLRIEAADSAGSTAQFQVVGGK